MHPTLQAQSASEASIPELSWFRNNVVENTIWPLALNRKNALFAGLDEGAAAWARIATLIETAKMNAVNLHACLKTTLEAIGRRPSGLRYRSAAALDLYANLTLKATWCSDTAYRTSYNNGLNARPGSLSVIVCPYCLRNLVRVRPHRSLLRSHPLLQYPG